MATKHKATPTTPAERHRYEKDGQQDFGWTNPQQLKIRNAVKVRRLRSAKAAKRGFARPARDGKGRFISKAQAAKFLE